MLSAARRTMAEMDPSAHREHRKRSRARCLRADPAPIFYFQASALESHLRAPPHRAAQGTASGRRRATDGEHLEAFLTMIFESEVGFLAALYSLATWTQSLASGAPPPVPTGARAPPPRLPRLHGRYTPLAGCLFAPAWVQARRKSRGWLSEKASYVVLFESRVSRRAADGADAGAGASGGVPSMDPVRRSASRVGRRTGHFRAPRAPTGLVGHLQPRRQRRVASPRPAGRRAPR